MKAASGGKRKEEIHKALRSRGGKDLSERELGYVIAALIKKGLLRDLNVGVQGPIPHRYQPESEFAPIADPNRVDKIADNRAKFAPIAEYVKKTVVETIQHIDEDQAWMKKRRIRAICDKEIMVELRNIAYLRECGYKLTSVFEFFTSSNPPIITGLFGFPKDLRGSISVPAPGTRIGFEEGNITFNPPDGKSPDDAWLFPSLLEWKDYLSLVVAELSEQS